MAFDFWRKKKETSAFPPLDEGLPGMEPILPGADANLPGADPTLPGISAGEEYSSTSIQTTFQPPGAEPSMSEEGFGQRVKPRLEPMKLETNPTYTAPREMEIMSAKIENIRLSLEVLNQKIDNIERLLKEKRTW